MFDLYVEKSPAILKAAMMLEECGLEYRCIHAGISEGKQHSPEFRALNPNGKAPVLIDHEPADGGEPLVVFESGAILVYLAEKTGRLLSAEPRRRAEAMQWLFWQSSGLSPLAGQAIHFIRYAPQEARPYGQLRYLGEVRRHYGVLDTHLQGRAFVAGDFSIADIGCFGWVNLYDRYGYTLSDWPNLERWWRSVAERPAVVRAYARVEAVRSDAQVTPEMFNRNLFGEAAAAAMAKG
jgi:GST-like protein